MPFVRTSFLPLWLPRLLTPAGGIVDMWIGANKFIVNPNYLDVYLADHQPRLNIGVSVQADSNAHMTSGEYAY